MEEAWLKQHHLTKAQLDQMSPEERDKIIAQMRAEIEEQIKRMTREKMDPETKLLV